jgi:hypothetical protein
MFIVPRVRTEDRSTSGGGSMIAGCGPCGVAFLKAVGRSGGGATTEFETSGAMRVMLEAKTTGGGAMASWGRCDESSSDQLRMFGNATSRFSLTTGAATIV